VEFVEWVSIQNLWLLIGLQGLSDMVLFADIIGMQLVKPMAFPNHWHNTYRLTGNTYYKNS
jgi:hypothetical protein